MPVERKPKIVARHYGPVSVSVRFNVNDTKSLLKKQTFRQESSEAFAEHACGKHRVAGYDNPACHNRWYFI
jgi:hypothetical protein